ncbi:threonine/serine exporter ThrE family protein [Corynebacterium sp. HMSC04H06]|uniref:threonine/serine exporter ThrE n=1 Tax=Corynebacterium sp. HMSC04H06 TaxID=1581050 RepID=UPI0008A4B19F|nr:threonine/serine exporter family protein [Corynebacterium sp. HMSC04H06]OFS21915.1 amino acid transporter [Corynebacterium sp. HMSC04H06]
MSVFSKLRGIFPGNSSSIATIDAAKAAPPPSPLAPIDLTDPAQVTGVMEIAARIGDLLICSGTSNSDTRAQVYLAAASYGLHYCHVGIVLNTITIHTNIGTGSDRRPVTVFRVASGLDVNFSRLAAVDRLIRSIHSGATPPAMAEKMLDDIEAMKPPRSVRSSLLGWGVMGGTFSVMLGGDIFVGVVSFFVALLIMSVNAWLGRFRLPPFYQNMVGGFIAVVPAAFFYRVASSIGLTFSPSQVIGMGIVVLVAGLTLVQCLVDGITKAPVTSSARFFEALLSTGAIIAGVGVGIQFVDYIGFTLPPLATIAPPVYHEIPLLILCGGVGSAGFAWACYASWSETIISGLTAAAGMFFYYFVIIPFGVSTVIASGISAVAVGLAGGLMARRFLIPPLVTMICGYTPMLPGLTLYRGMYAALNEQMITGMTNLVTALAIAGALAAGVVFGERGARRLRRPKYFRPYSAFKRLGRYSFHQATRLANSRPRIPRVPLSPFAPRQERPVPPPVHGPKPPTAAQQARQRQDETATQQWQAQVDAGEIDDHWPQRTEWPAQPQPLREDTIYTTPGTEEFYAAHADPDQR